MIDNNTSKFRGFDNERVTDKISDIVKGLDFSDDRMTFIEQMITLNKLLSLHDPYGSTSFRTVDDKAQDPTYFIATYFDTKDIDQALWVYRLVRLLTRYILLSDKYFETDNVEFDLMAKRVRTLIDEFLLTGTDKNHLNYSIDNSLTQFWAAYQASYTWGIHLFIQGNTAF